jgi:Male sterility protein.
MNLKSLDEQKVGQHVYYSTPDNHAVRWKSSYICLGSLLVTLQCTPHHKYKKLLQRAKLLPGVISTIQPSVLGATLQPQNFRGFSTLNCCFQLLRVHYWFIFPRASQYFATELLLFERSGYINKLRGGKYPSVSVISTWKDPVPGWIDNLYGPTGIVTGVEAGLIRTVHCNPNVTGDMVPADLTTNALVCSAWDASNR